MGSTSELISIDLGAQNGRRSLRRSEDLPQTLPKRGRRGERTTKESEHETDGIDRIEEGKPMVGSTGPYNRR